MSKSKALYRGTGSLEDEARERLDGVRLVFGNAEQLGDLKKLREEDDRLRLIRMLEGWPAGNCHVCGGSGRQTRGKKPGVCEECGGEGAFTWEREGLEQLELSQLRKIAGEHLDELYEVFAETDAGFAWDVDELKSVQAKGKR